LKKAVDGLGKKSLNMDRRTTAGGFNDEQQRPFGDDLLSVLCSGIHRSLQFGRR
jgi:hypothetical protein